MDCAEASAKLATKAFTKMGKQPSMFEGVPTLSLPKQSTELKEDKTLEVGGVVEKFPISLFKKTPYILASVGT